MHKIILFKEKFKFIIEDNIKPLLIVIFLTYILRYIFPYTYHTGLFNQIFNLIISYSVIFSLFLISIKSIRNKIIYNFLKL